MGAVKRETPGQNRGCHEYENISLSAPEMVSLLIRHRCEIYPPEPLEQAFRFRELLACIYIDLDQLVKGAALCDGERKVVKLLMSGYTIMDIVETQDISRATVYRLLDGACKQIADLNNTRWLAHIVAVANRSADQSVRLAT